jgi:hypothetical protein
MPKKIMYPCQYPDCNARYDETIAGRVQCPTCAQFFVPSSGTVVRRHREQGGTATCPGSYSNTGILNGWIYPHDVEEKDDVRTHDHILNVMHKVEVDDE